MRELNDHGLARKVGCLVGTAMLLGVAICLMVMLASRVDHYKFIGGRKPIFGGVTPAYSHGPTFGRDYSAYSWEENYRQVLSKAKGELASMGFRITQESKDGVIWEREPYVLVGIMPGRSDNKNDYWRPRSTDPHWVTVHTSIPAEDSWSRQLRSALEQEPPYEETSGNR
jgi:hypothetical protein